MCLVDANMEYYGNRRRIFKQAFGFRTLTIPRMTFAKSLFVPLGAFVLVTILMIHVVSWRRPQSPFMDVSIRKALLYQRFMDHSNLKLSLSSPIDSLLVAGHENINLSNITRPLWTVFPKDLHLESFMSYFTKVITRVTELPKEYSINSPSLCMEEDIRLVIMIPSVVKDSIIREEIRRTWASRLYNERWEQTQAVRLVFVFGDLALGVKDIESLKKESTTFGDIVTIKMVDSYENLSLKVASMLQWSEKFCTSANYVMKIDVDTLCNIPLLLKLLDTIPSQNISEAHTIGFRHKYNPPIAMHSGKWAIPLSIYPYENLPRYVYGHSYVLSRQAVDRLVASFPYFPIVPNEDAFITGIMSLVANVTRVHSPAFAHLFRKQSYQDVQDNRFVSTIHHKTNLRNIWNEYIHRNATDKLV